MYGYGKKNHGTSVSGVADHVPSVPGPVWSSMYAIIPSKTHVQDWLGHDRPCVWVNPIANLGVFPPAMMPLTQSLQLWMMSRNIIGRDWDTPRGIQLWISNRLSRIELDSVGMPWGCGIHVRPVDGTPYAHWSCHTMSCDFFVGQSPKTRDRFIEVKDFMIP